MIRLDQRLRLSGQFFVVDIEESICRQDVSPVIDQSLIVTEIGDEFCPSGRKCQGWMEVGLMNRKRRVDGSAVTVNKDSAGECQVNQPSPEKVERHLVGHPRGLRRDTT